MSPPATSRFVTTPGGLRLHYLEHEHPRGGEAEPVVLLHGLSSNARVFDAVASAGLADARRLVALDLRGRGLSDKPATGYSMEEHALDVLALLDALGLARASLVGHSFGGRLAFYLAARHPERVRSVVSLDAVAEFHPRTSELLVPSLARLGRTYPSFGAFLDEMRATPQFEGFEFDEALVAHYRADAVALEDGRVRPGTTMPIIAEAGTRAAAEPWYEHLGMIRAPALLVHCEGPYGGAGAVPLVPRELAEKTVRALREGSLERVPGNHMTMMFGPNAPYVARAVLGFLQRTEAHT